MEREESVRKRVSVSKRSLVGVLFHTVRVGNMDAFRKLLRYQSSDGSTIDVNTQDTDSNGATLLHVACSKGNEMMVVALLGAGADVSIVASFGTSVLHDASKQNNINIIRLLVERGAHVLAEDEFIRMPLHIACHFGNYKVALALIRCGAPPRAREIV
jgi:ankyrin repeat protein